MKAPPDMQIADAIAKAAANLGTDGTGHMGLIGYLEFLRVREPALFAQIIAKANIRKANDDG